jgi:PKD repeat protein
MKYLLFIFLLAVIVITAGCINGNQNTLGTPTPTPVGTSTLAKPIAMFLPDEYSGSAPLWVQFFNHATNAETYLWDFGDGNTSSQYSPSHTYTNPGKYTVSLTATNSLGSDVEKVESAIIVTGPPPKIVVKSTWQVAGLKNPVPMSTHWDVVNIGDGDGKNVQCEVTFFYDDNKITNDTVYFGTIKAGESKIKDQTVFVPFPEKYNGDLIKMTYRVFIDGKEQYE